MARITELPGSRTSRGSRTYLKGLAKSCHRLPTPDKAGDLVIVGRWPSLNSTMKCPGFNSEYYGPCPVIRAKRPRYTLQSQHDRFSSGDIHTRRLGLYYSRSSVSLAMLPRRTNIRSWAHVRSRSDGGC